MVAVPFIPQQRSGMFIVLIFQVTSFYFPVSLLSKILCYNFTWKNYRRDANGSAYIKSKMELSIMSLQILENLEIRALNVPLP